MKKYRNRIIGIIIIGLLYAFIIKISRWGRVTGISSIILLENGHWCLLNGNIVETSLAIFIWPRYFELTLLIPIYYCWYRIFYKNFPMSFIDDDFTSLQQESSEYTDNY